MLEPIIEHTSIQVQQEIQKIPDIVDHLIALSIQQDFAGTKDVCP